MPSGKRIVWKQDIIYKSLCISANRGCLENVKLLLNAFDYNNTESLLLESTKHSHIFELFFADERLHDQFTRNCCLQIACSENNAGVIRLLMKDRRVDPTKGNNMFIKRAMNRQNYEIVELLYNDQRVRNTLDDALREEITNFIASKP